MKSVKRNVPVLFTPQLSAFELRYVSVSSKVFSKPNNPTFKRGDFKALKDIEYTYNVVAWIPRQFLAANSFYDDSEAMRLFLYARLISAETAGYFKVEQLNEIFESRSTKYRVLNHAMSLGFIHQIKRGVYKTVSMKKQEVNKRRGLIGLTEKALEEKEVFRSWMVAGEQRYMIKQNRSSLDRFAKYKRADKRVKKFNELLNTPKGEWSDKERRSTRAKLQEYEINDYKALPKNISKLCFQYLDPEKPYQGYVSNQMTANYWGISMTRASRYRWKAHEKGFHRVELQAVEITAAEAAYAPYLQDHFQGRVFQKDGKWYVRMTSKITSKIRIRTTKPKTKNNYSIL